VKRFYLIFLLALIFIIGNDSNILAYDNINAAIYADNWALSRNSKYPNFSSDCTNFVSQALHEGGKISFDYAGGWFCYKNWYGGFSYGKPWSVAVYHQIWLIENEGGTIVGMWGPTQQGDINYSLRFGDVLIYDWGTGEGWSHAAIVTDYGQDPHSPHYGDLQDQHTTDRKWAIWHLKPYNKYSSTTTIMAIRPK
jgi:cell wall-associated NlpC family hydrolase